MGRAEVLNLDGVQSCGSRVFRLKCKALQDAATFLRVKAVSVQNVGGPDVVRVVVRNTVARVKESTTRISPQEEVGVLVGDRQVSRVVLDHIGKPDHPCRVAYCRGNIEG